MVPLTVLANVDVVNVVRFCGAPDWRVEVVEKAGTVTFTLP